VSTTAITGRLRDIKPNAVRPTLELHFSNVDLAHLPPGHKDPITLLIDGTNWTGTIGLRPGNDPYVHTYLHSSGTKRSCTDVFLALGLAEKAVLGFTVRERGVLELVEIQDPGSWRPGGHPDERAGRPAPLRPRTRADNRIRSATVASTW